MLSNVTASNVFGCRRRKDRIKARIVSNRYRITPRLKCPGPGSILKTQAEAKSGFRPYLTWRDGLERHFSRFALAGSDYGATRFWIVCFKGQLLRIKADHVREVFGLLA